MPEVPSIRIDAAGSILVFSAYSEDWAGRTALQHRAPSPEVHLEWKAVIGAAAAKAHFVRIADLSAKRSEGPLPSC